MEAGIQIFTSPDGNAEIEVHFTDETFWLNLNEIARLFEKDKSVISRHLKNIFETRELERISVVAKKATTATDGKTYEVDYYNLDAILSVGYRVNSKRGTQFRQWANRKLKEYLTEGLAINQRRLEQKNKEIQFLHDGIRILSRAIEDQALNNGSNEWLFQFSLGLQLLDDYDHESLDEQGIHIRETVYPKMSEYQTLIDQMRVEFDSSVFGKEKDGGFESAVNQIRQGFGDTDAYPSLEEKAAMLLYLVVKNHAFVDGNKRIAAGCFLLFLQRNGLLHAKNGQPIISNEALASLTLFVAASKAEEVTTVKKLLVSVLNRNSQIA